MEGVSTPSTRLGDGLRRPLNPHSKGENTPSNSDAALLASGMR